MDPIGPPSAARLGLVALLHDEYRLHACSWEEHWQWTHLSSLVRIREPQNPHSGTSGSADTALTASRSRISRSPTGRSGGRAPRRPPPPQPPGGAGRVAAPTA